MKISPVLNRMNFTSNVRVEYKNPPKAQEDIYFGPQYGEVKNSNYTTFFRSDFFTYINQEPSLGNYRKLLEEKYKDADKVNVYDFGASDGSEAYSLAIDLIEHFGEEMAQKFFPIKAFDMDEEIVEIAKSRKISADLHDFKRIMINTKGNAGKYFEVGDNENELFPFLMTPKGIFDDKIAFNVGDFRDLVNEVEPSNSIVLCRNFLSYMSKDDMTKAFDKLCERLDSSSLIVTGSFDKDQTDVVKVLNERGFEEISNNIFAKTSKDKT